VTISYVVHQWKSDAVAVCAVGNVRFGSLADMCGAKGHVRFTPKSGCLLRGNSGHFVIWMRCPLYPEESCHHGYSHDLGGLHRHDKDCQVARRRYKSQERS